MKHLDKYIQHDHYNGLAYFNVREFMKYNLVTFVFKKEL